MEDSGASAYRLFVLAPRLPGGWFFLGERTKICPVSPVRFRDVHVVNGCLLLERDPASMSESIAVAAIRPSGQYVEVTAQSGLSSVTIICRFNIGVVLFSASYVAFSLACQQ